MMTRIQVITRRYPYFSDGGNGIAQFEHSVSCFCLVGESTRRYIKMKVVFLALALIAFVSAYPQPQKEGGAYTNEAIRQAQQTFLIPKDAQIQKVQEGIEIGAYESIPGDQKINLFEILGDQFPPEVVNNLQGQIDQVGKN
ncbi:hypothetical protein GWI33_019102 [Rhynchophorus ferrugineus]|uniref:Uncharacterized protein n=2 Tax=Rhynchophorus ferrugineus TaxID=354439 RepID=A0A834HSE1_RHYFE|nr:hypothetical protein GWI33_019102 [Rhynchophorus ferrugineus]